jgi:protein-disulfide isomerase
MEIYEEEKGTFWRNAALVLIGLFIGYIIGRFELTTITIKNDQTAPAKNTVNEVQNTNTEATVNQVVASADDDPFIGQEEAAITIIDFSDYQCPFSAKFYSEILPQLKTDYIQTGKVKYVFRDFPLNIHPKAQYAHYAAECAKEQSKYWEMHDILFEKQKEWSEAEDLVETFTLYAGEIKLNTVNFKNCMTSETYKDEVAKDREDGISYGVKGTPTIIINGNIVKGISTYEQLKQLLEKEL